MGKHSYNYTTAYHSPQQHGVLSLWKGSVQATNKYDLEKEYREYDLCIFLDTFSPPEEIPFCIGVEGPKLKTRMVNFRIKDRHAPDDGPYWVWFRSLLVKELKAGAKIGMACHGGHGRTGTILAILQGLHDKEVLGKIEENPIKTVRSIVGCDELVESEEQELFVYEQLELEVSDKVLASDHKNFSFKGNWMANGKTIAPISLEPQDLGARAFVMKKDSVVDADYVVCTKEGWAVPTDEGGIRPVKFCDRCQATLGWKIPIKKDSKLECTVCPLLNAMGAVNSVEEEQRKKGEARKKGKVIQMPASGGAAETEGDKCDNCGNRFESGKGWYRYTDSPLQDYQFCSEKCKEEYEKQAQFAPAMLSSSSSPENPSGANFDSPCDAYVNGSFCDVKPTHIYRMVNGKGLYFCTWNHVALEEHRRKVAVTPQRKALPAAEEKAEEKEEHISLPPMAVQKEVLKTPLEEIVEGRKKDRSVARWYLAGSRLVGKRVAPNGTILPEARGIKAVIDYFAGKGGEA